MSKESRKSLYIVAYVTETKKTEYVYNTDFMTSDEIDQLMKEDMFIEEKREKTTKMLKALDQADVITCLLD